MATLSVEDEQPSRSVSQSTLARRAMAAKKKGQQAQSALNKEAYIAELKVVGVIHPERKCGVCESKGRTCKVWPPEYGRETKPCLACKGDSRARCKYPDATLTPPVQEHPAPRRAVERQTYTVHTKHWFKALPRPAQRQYVANQIQWSGIRKSDGPCARCVYLGVPCRVLDPESPVASFTSTTKCASCIFSDGTYGNAVERKCGRHGISHFDHESKLDPRILFQPVREWQYHMISNMAPREEVVLAEEMSDAIGEENEQLRPQIVSSRASTRRQVNLVRSSFDLEKVQQDFEQLDYLLGQFANLLPHKCPSLRAVLPFESESLQKLAIWSGEFKIGNLNVMSALGYLLKANQLSDVSLRIQQMQIRHLSYGCVLRAVVSKILMDLVFGSTPDALQAFQETLEKGFNLDDDDLNLLVEDYFDSLYDTDFVQNSMKYLAEKASKKLYSAIEPIVLLLNNEIDKKVRDFCLQHCYAICEKALLLNAYLRFKPTHPVELLDAFSGDTLGLGSEEMDGTSDADEQKIAIMLMCGLQSADPARPPTVHVKARVATIPHGSSQMEIEDADDTRPIVSATPKGSSISATLTEEMGDTREELSSAHPVFSSSTDSVLIDLTKSFQNSVNGTRRRAAGKFKR